MQWVDLRKSELSRLNMASNNTTISYTFYSGLRGFHVYKNIWVPYPDQVIQFRQEHDNEHDDFAVAGTVRLPGRLVPRTVVGHIPGEISRYVWFALAMGAKVTGSVVSERHTPSPLFQGGLEIPINIRIEWAKTTKNEKALDIFKEKIAAVKFSDYKDESTEILKTLVGDNTEEDFDFDEVATSDEEEEDEEEATKHPKKKKRIILSSSSDDENE